VSALYNLHGGNLETILGFKVLLFANHADICKQFFLLFSKSETFALLQQGHIFQYSNQVWLSSTSGDCQHWRIFHKSQ
jgi:hypothetical protein